MQHASILARPTDRIHRIFLPAHGGLGLLLKIRFTVELCQLYTGIKLQRYTAGVVAGPGVDAAVDQALLDAWRRLVPPLANWRTRLDEVCRELRLSPAAVTALLSVDPAHPGPMRDLAAVLDCDASYVTAMVDDLERAGYAERRTAPEDRRVKTIALTPEGVRARAVAENALAAPPRQLLALPARDRRALLDILQRALES
jgi:DNA-binding MarR family transcriptional regulator